MPTVRKTVIVDRPAETLFALVDDVERYPQFLPWCSGAKVLERSGDTTHARLDIDFHGLKSHFATVNRKVPPEWMHLDFSDGPFQRFHGHWRFVALGAEGCRVEFALDYAFENAALEALLGPVFGHIVETLVDRFVARAETMGGAVKVSLVVALPRQQEVIELVLPTGSTVGDAVRAADLARRFPGVDVAKWSAGVWSAGRSEETPLREGDRVELYRELLADAKQMRRERVKVKRATRSRSGS